MTPISQSCTRRRCYNSMESRIFSDKSKEKGSTSPSRSPPLMDSVRAALRARHYSYLTEKAYTSWIRRYIIFHDRRHPRTMGSAEITAFLTHLAVDNRVAPSSQNQALQALLFLYR